MSGADASIYGQVRQPVAPEGPLDAYTKVATLKHLMGQGKLQDLQQSDLEQTLGEKKAARGYLSTIAPGADMYSPEVQSNINRLAPTTLGPQWQKAGLEQREKNANIAHTTAQTNEITAGHIASGMAAVLKGNGSDESIAQLAQMMSPIVGEERAQASAAQLLALPPERRVTAALAGAVQHKNGIEALKLMFPDAHMQNVGDKVVPVSTSTLPGGPAPGSAVPGGVATELGQSPDSVAARETQVSEGKLNRASHEQIARNNDARQREMNGILAGQEGVDLTPTATAIANHDVPLPNPPSGSRNPMAMANYNKLLTRVKEINPTYNAIDYQVSQQAMKAFGTGKQGQEVQSGNTGVNHVATLEQLALAQKNGNTQLFNKIANEFASQTGGTAPTNLKAAIMMVAPEITKAVVGAGGGVEDRNKAAAALNPNYSPDQFLGATKTIKELFSGRLSEAERTYERTTKRKDFRTQLLSPAAAEILNGRGGKEAPSGPAAGSVQDGYKFKGGDPSKRENWEKV